MRYLGAPYPIEKNPLGLLHTQEGLNQVKSDLLALLLTNPGERVMLNAFGTPLRTLFFEQNDLTTTQTAKTMIANAIRMWEPRITVSSIEVVSNINTDSLDNSDTYNEIEHILGIKITFFDPIDIGNLQELVLEVPLNLLGG